MNHRLDFLKAHEVPESLDRRIMAAAAHRAGVIRFRRVLCRHVLSTGAAAAALLAAGTVFFLSEGNRETPGVSSRPGQSELMALNDWTTLEQESYNLSFELYSDRQSLAELARVSLQEEE